MEAPLYRVMEGIVCFGFHSYLWLADTLIPKARFKRKGNGCDSVSNSSCQRTPWKVWWIKQIHINTREEPMNQTHSRTPCQQVQWVSTLLAQRGSYGVVTMASQELGVARQTLYRWKAKGQAALEAAFTPALHTADPAGTGGQLGNDYRRCAGGRAARAAVADEPDADHSARALALDELYGSQ